MANASSGWIARHRASASHAAPTESGAPQLIEHHAMRWVTVPELDQYAFCPADQAIIETLKARRAE